jgi:hypothetical protein
MTSDATAEREEGASNYPSIRVAVSDHAGQLLPLRSPRVKATINRKRSLTGTFDVVPRHKLYNAS